MATVTQAAVSPIEAAIAAQKNRLASGDYTIVGQVDLIHTEGRGTIEFRKHGPMLATVPERSDLLIASEVLPLPPLRTLLEEPCPECKATCPQCQGTRRSLCSSCGGAGKIAAADNCTCISGYIRASVDCPLCLGTGRRTVMRDCVCCGGVGKSTCMRCFGTGEAGTGRTGAGDAERLCAACGGQMRKAAMVEQKLESFVQGTLEGRVALGPIRSIVFHSVERFGSFEIIDFHPDPNGNLAVLLLEFSPGDKSHLTPARGYLVGGLPVLRAKRRGV